MIAAIRFRYPAELVREFYFAWRASERTLTLSGGGFLDEPPGFWEDIWLMDELYTRAEQEIAGIRGPDGKLYRDVEVP